MKNTGRVHSFETLGTVDGPGIRFVIFLQGCALRCQYCHNPDTWKINEGEEYTVDDLMFEIKKYKTYMEASSGGVTFTGGDPLVQAEFLTELAKKCKEEGISVVVDTSGFILNDKVKELYKYTDLVLLDIKSFDEETYQLVSGGKLSPTLETLDHLKEKNIEVWVRYVVVPELTDDLESIKALSNHLDDFPNVTKIEPLAFHKMGEYKWEELGEEYKLKDTKEPKKELMEEVKKIFKTNGKNVIINT